MKQLRTKSKKWFVVLVAAMTTLGFQSCLDDDNTDYALLYPNALVTVKNNATDNSCYLQLDERTTLLPVNMKTSPFGEKEVRALVNYSNVDEPSGEYSQAVHVNWIDSLLTKPMAPNLGETQNNEPSTSLFCVSPRFGAIGFGLKLSFPVPCTARLFPPLGSSPF